MQFDLTDLVLEYVPYKSDPGGRVWIGNVCVADVYERRSGGDLFKPLTIQHEFHIGFFMKHQPEGKWLEHTEQHERERKFDSIEEGLKWIIEKFKQ